MRAPRLACLAALLLCAALGAEDDAGAPRDTVVLREGRTMEVYLVSEAYDKITYRTAPAAQPSQRRTREVLRIDYAGMAGGEWKRASQLRDQGDYAGAAEAFAAVAAGDDEWRKVYGGMAAGDCLEEAQRAGEAAKAFAAVAQGFPKHRLAVDAAYRAGMALASIGQAEAAEKVAAGLSAAAKTLNASGPEYRAAAVRTAIAATRAKQADREVDQLARKVLLRAADDGDVWYHFNRWLASAYLASKRGADAARVVERMLPDLAGDPARTARMQLLRGRALVDDDPQGAIVELLKLDCLPYGPADSIRDARWLAGRLLVEQATALRAEKDARKGEVADELLATARVVLAAAVAGPAGPARDQARTLLASIQPAAKP